MPTKVEILRELANREGVLTEKQKAIIKQLDAKGDLEASADALLGKIKQQYQQAQPAPAPAPETAPEVPATAAPAAPTGAPAPAPMATPSPATGAPPVPAQGAPSQPSIVDQMPTPQNRVSSAPGVGQFLVGAGENLLSLGSGAIAEPVAGLAGLGATILKGPTKGADIVNRVRESMTYSPRTESGKQTAKDLGLVAQGIAGPAIGAYEKGVSAVSGLTGEIAGPTAAGLVGSALQTAPAAAMEYLGAKGTGKLFSAGPKPVANVAGRTARNVGTQELEAGARQVAKVASGRRSAMETITEAVNPDPDILKAAKEFGVEEQLLPSHSSQNPVYRAVEQGLASVPGSELAASQKRTLQLLGDKADKLITEFGGSLDKTVVSDQFKTRMNKTIDDLSKASDLLYDKVSEKIPKNTPVEANKVRSMIQKEADDLGGLEYLEPEERKLFNQLDPKTKPTYARLDKLRKDIGATLNRKSDTFKNVEEGRLKRLYGALTEDQSLVADQFGVADAYDSAKKLVVQRKAIEEKFKNIAGKDLMGNISTKAKPAILNLQNGNTKEFDKLIRDIPSELGADAKKEILATSLNDAFTQGSRKQRSLNVAGFDDWMTGVKKNQAAVNRMKKELGEKEWNRLDNFHKVVNGVRRAMEDQISTGRSALVPKVMDEVSFIGQKLFGVAERVPVVGGLVSKRTPRSVKADRVLASPRFAQMVRDSLVKSRNAKAAEKAFMATPEYKAWAKSLTKQEIKQLAAIGVMGYLMSKPEEKKD